MLTVRQHWVCITLKMRTPQNYVKNADTTEAYFNKSHLLRRVRFNKVINYLENFVQLAVIRDIVSLKLKSNNAILDKIE